MTIARKLSLVAAGIIVLLLLGVTWALGTTSGTRFLISRAPLPPELTLGEIHGSLLRGVRAASIDWRGEGQHVSARDVRIELALRRLLARHVWLQSVDVAALTVDLQPTDNPTPAGDLPAFASPVPITIEAASIRGITWRQGDLQRFVDELRLAGGIRESQLSDLQVSLESTWLAVNLAGQVATADDYRANLDASWRWTDAETGSFAGELAVRGTLQDLTVEHSLQAPVALLTTGMVGYSAGNLQMDLTHAWDSLAWQTDSNQLHAATGTLRLFGDLDDLQFVLRTDALVDDWPETRVEAAGRVDRDGAQFSSLDTSNSLGRLSANGSAAWSGDPSFDVTFEVSGIDPVLANAALSGSIGARGTARGVFAPDAPVVSVLLDVLDGEVNGHRFSGGGAISYTPDLITVTRVRVRVGKNELRLHGQRGSNISLAATAELPAISEILPDMSGNLSLVLDVSGPTARPRVQLHGTGADILVSGQTLTAVEFEATGRLDQHTFDARLVTPHGNADVSLDGRYVDDKWSGDINRFGIDNEVAGRWSTRMPSHVTASREQLSLEALCLQSETQEGEACASIDVENGGAVNFDVSVRRLPLAALPTTLPADIAVSGTGNAHARGTYSAGKLSSDLSLGLNGAGIAAVVDDEPLSASFARATGSATINDNALQSTLQFDIEGGVGTMELQLGVADILDSTSTISGNGSLSISDLSLVAIFIPDLSDPRGTVGGELDIGGTLEGPELTGNIAINDAAVGIRRAGLEISEINVSLSQTSPGRLQFEGGARSGDGRVSIRGDTWVSSATGVRSEFRLSGEDFELVRLPDWQVSASPDIVAVFDDRSTRISGTLTVPSADIRIRELPTSAVSTSRDAVVHRDDGIQTVTTRRIDVDVSTALGDDVKFAGFGLSTGITGTVQLRGGSHQAFKGYGRLSLLGGRYKAYGQDLEIERGELIFNGPLDNPQLDVRAIRQAVDVVAGIQLAGTVQQLQSSVFSEPSMSEAEALSYLLTGRPLSSAADSGDTDMLSSAAFALGVSGTGSIVSQMRSELGLDTLAIEGGLDDSRLIAGKRFGNRLLVEYGYGLIDKMGTLLLRYSLNDRITLESRTGKVTNFDIVYSVKKK